MKCSIVIVTYNAKDYTRVCLEKLSAGLAGHKDWEVILFDNDSKDGVREVLKQYQNKDNFAVVFNDKNIGFAAGNNEAFKLAKGEYVFRMDPDTEVPVEEIEKLIRYLDEHNDVGVVGPKIVGPLGVVQESYGQDMTVMSEWVGKIFGSKYMFNLPVIRQIRDRHYNKTDATDVGWVGGASLMIRKKLIDSIGGIDPHFFYSAGDMVDFCASVKERGFRIVLYPQAIIMHNGGGTAAADKTESLRKSFEGSLYFFKKHYGFSGYIGAKIAYIVTSLIKGCAAFIIFLVTFKKEYSAIFRSHFTNVGRLVVGRL